MTAQTVQGALEDDGPLIEMMSAGLAGLTPGNGQATLFDFPDRAALGRVYLATDGVILKRGYVSRQDRLKKRKGEHRGEIISSKPGTRADEDADLNRVRKWRSEGTEWFRVPDDPQVLYWLWEDTTCSRLCPAGRMLLSVIAANLRQQRPAA